MTATAPKPGGTPAAAKRDTRTALMDAAEQIVRAKGADGFSYADLADAIGIRKASIHYHFPSKADLLTGIMARYRGNMLSALNDMTGDAGQQLSGFLALYRDALTGGQTLCLCVSLSLSMHGLTDEALQEIEGFRSAVRAWLHARFEQAQRDGSVSNPGDPAAEAATTLALAEGAQITARFAKDPTIFEHAVGMLQARLDVSR